MRVPMVISRKNSLNHSWDKSQQLKSDPEHRQRKWVLHQEELSSFLLCLNVVFAGRKQVTYVGMSILVFDLFQNCSFVKFRPMFLRTTNHHRVTPPYLWTDWLLAPPTCGLTDCWHHPTCGLTAGITLPVDSLTAGTTLPVDWLTVGTTLPVDWLLAPPYLWTDWLLAPAYRWNCFNETLQG